jgi:hypothetical protein
MCSVVLTVYPWRTMPDESKDQQETEQTPKGLTVPVPEREDFFVNLRKVAEPDKPVPMDEDPSSPHGDPLDSESTTGSAEQ